MENVLHVMQAREPAKMGHLFRQPSKPQVATHQRSRYSAVCVRVTALRYEVTHQANKIHTSSVPAGRGSRILRGN